MSQKPQRLRLIPQSAATLNLREGLKGEIYYDSDVETLRLYDGDTQGGRSLARSDLANVSNQDFLTKATAAGFSGGVQPGAEGRLAYYPATGSEVNDLAEVYWHTHDGTSMLHIEGQLEVSGQKNKIRFHWDTLADLQSQAPAVTWHGMVAHAHDTGLLYYAHSSQWTALARQSDIPQVPPATTVSSTAPASPTVGQIWFDLESGRMYVWVNDGSSSQWIQPAAPTYSEGAGTVTWNDITGKPTFATVATSGSYADLSNTPAAYAATSISAFSDVDTTTTPPTTGQVLKWNGTNWAPGSDIASGGGGTDADTLDGFDSSYYLNFNNLSNKPQIFSSIAVAGQSTVTADSSADTLTLTAGAGITITTNSGTDTVTIGSSVVAVTYAVSAETNALGADIRLTGSDATTDNLTIAAGSNVTVTRTNANTITIAATAGGGGGNTFSSIAVAGQSTVSADSTTDTLTLVAGSGVTITTDSGTDTVTFTASGSNGFGTVAVAGQDSVTADQGNDTVNFAAGSGITITTTPGTSTVTITNSQSAPVTNFSALTDSSTAGMTVDEFYLPAITALEVTANGSTAYRFDQYGSNNNPTVYAINGTTIAFKLNISGHPFLIQDGTGTNYDSGLVHVSTNGTVTTGASAQGQTSGTLYWKVPSSISGNYRYQCSFHVAMVGTITVKNFVSI